MSNLSDDYDAMMREQRDICDDRFGNELQHTLADHGKAQPCATPQTRLIITFGQDHTHRVNSVTIDCNSLVRVTGPDYATCRRYVWELFKGVFAFDYEESKFTHWHYYPRGVVLELEAS
jgi:hypothetical protein